MIVRGWVCVHGRKIVNVLLIEIDLARLSNSQTVGSMYEFGSVVRSTTQEAIIPTMDGKL